MAHAQSTPANKETIRLGKHNKCNKSPHFTNNKNSETNRFLSCFHPPRIRQTFGGAGGGGIAEQASIQSVQEQASCSSSMASLQGVVAKLNGLNGTSVPLLAGPMWSVKLMANGVPGLFGLPRKVTHLSALQFFAPKGEHIKSITAALVLGFSTDLHELYVSLANFVSRKIPSSLTKVTSVKTR